MIKTLQYAATFFTTFCLFVACQPNQNANDTTTQKTPFALTLDSFSNYIQEKNMAVSPDKYSEHTTPYLQNLLMSYHDSCNIFSQKITRLWQREFNDAKNVNASPLFKTWLELELLRFDVEERILAAFKNLNNLEIVAAMQALGANDEEQRMKLITSQMSSDSLFSVAINELRSQKEAIENNPKILLP